MRHGRVLRIGLSLALLGWVLAGVLGRDGMQALAARVAEIDARYLALAVACQFVAVAAGAARWGELLRHEGLHQAPGWLMKHSLVARFIGSFTPSTTGVDGYRVLIAARATQRPAGAARALALEKCTGLPALALLTMGTVGVGALDVPVALAWPSLAAVLSVAALGLGLLARPDRVLSLWPRRAPLRARVEKLVAKLKGPRLCPLSLLRAAALGLSCHAATACTFVAAGWALSLPVAAADLFGVGCAIIAATLLPISVGGVGVREGVAIVLLGRLGPSAIEATCLALLAYAAGQVPSVAGGVLGLAPTPDQTETLEEPLAGA